MADFRHITVAPANSANENRDCPVCGAPLPEGATTCPHCEGKKSSGASKSIPLVLVILVLCSSLLTLSTSYRNFTTVPVSDVEEKPAVASVPTTTTAAAAKRPAGKDLNLESYGAAVGFVVQQFPYAEKISDFKQSPIDRVGNEFTVVVLFDTTNSSGASVRNVCSVDMEFSKGEWRLRRIRQ